MKKITPHLIVLLALLVTTISCKKEEIPNGPNSEIPPVSQFVYEGMSALYLWNTEVTGKKPTAANTDAKAYFRSILNNKDKEYNWSWITDDAKALVAEFAGEPKTFGFIHDFIRGPDNNVYAYIKYVYSNTPASRAGLKRLDLIGKIDGRRISTVKGSDGLDYISSKDFNDLSGNTPGSFKFTIYKLIDDGSVVDVVEDRIVEGIAPITTKTDPVLFDSVYTVGDKKIGYIFYTEFISNFNYRLHEVFSKFKQEGVADLVLDLRYNHGGSINSACYLASMIAPVDEVKKKSVFTIFSYNDDIGKESDRLGVYVEKDVIVNDSIITKAEPNPLDANINLGLDENRIHVIATDDSYSASELVTFCLRQFMDVTHIGGKTGGKYTGSITIHAYDGEIGFPFYETFKIRTLSREEKSELSNWAMQPIVAIYTDNKGNDFIDTDGLAPSTANTISEGFGSRYNWVSIGDTGDTLLGRALYLITGDESYNYTPPATTARSGVVQTIETRKANTAKELRKESVLIDNFWQRKE